MPALCYNAANHKRFHSHCNCYCFCPAALRPGCNQFNRKLTFNISSSGLLLLFLLLLFHFCYQLPGHFGLLFSFEIFGWFFYFLFANFSQCNGMRTHTYTLTSAHFACCGLISRLVAWTLTFRLFCALNFFSCCYCSFVEIFWLLDLLIIYNWLFACLG